MSTWEEKDEKCGTVCCAAGWAGHMPAFRKAGFKTEREQVFCKRVKEDYFYSFEPFTSGEACEQFFGNYRDLFDPIYYMDNNIPYKTPKQVAKHIRSFVKKDFPNLVS